MPGNTEENRQETSFTILGALVKIRTWNIFYPMVHQSPVDQGHLNIEILRSHTLDTSQSVGLLWTGDRPIAETPT
jgi:hypothetical protein